MNERLRTLRNALGLKQREIAERLEVQTGLIGNWESGNREIPKTRIYQICKEFNVSREWFETGNGEMFVPTPEQISEEQAQEKFIFDVFKRLTDEQQKRIIHALEKYLDKLKSPGSGNNVNISNSQNFIGQLINGPDK